MTKPISEKVLGELTASPRRHYFGGSKLAGQTAPSGFGVDVLPSGTRSFFLHYRRDGRPYWHTLGKWIGSPKGGQLSVAAAIRLARERAEELTRPSADPRPPRTRRQQDGGAIGGGVETVAQIVDRYLERVRKDRRDFRTLRQVEGTLGRFVKPILGKLPAHELRRKDVADMLDRVADDATPLMADKTFNHFQAAWRWASDRDERLPWPFVRGMRRTNPADHVRTRVLSDEEIAVIWKATADGRPFSRYVRFLLITAARRTEAMLPWDELDATRGVWTLPAARNKVKFDLPRPLSKSALSQLVMNGEACAFSFTNGMITRQHRILLKRSGTAGWRLHDLRRSARTLLSRAGVSTEVAERALGHKAPVIERTYNRYGFDDELRHAYEALAQLIQQIADPQENVVAIRGRP
jgi:integrase